MKLHFGCGTNKLEGFINIDIENINNPEVIWNMNNFPYPFGNDSADEIICNMTLEHINEPIRAIGEFNRILKKGCYAKIVVPHATSITALSGEVHKRVFWAATFWHLEKESENKWHVVPIFSSVNTKLVFSHGKMRLINKPMQWIFGDGRIPQTFYEQFISQIIRCNEIHVELIK